MAIHNMVKTIFGIGNNTIVKYGADRQAVPHKVKHSIYKQHVMVFILLDRFLKVDSDLAPVLKHIDIRVLQSFQKSNAVHVCLFLNKTSPWYLDYRPWHHATLTPLWPSKNHNILHLHWGYIYLIWVKFNRVNHLNWIIFYAMQIQYW